MSDYNWCHGPNCHTYQTQSRIRGSGRDKVLRTRKVKAYYTYETNPSGPHIFDFFCDQRCLMDYVRKHLQQITQHEPRTQPLELPINVTKTTQEGWNGRTYTQTNIERVDNN